MSSVTARALDRVTDSPAAQFVLFLVAQKPPRFEGWLLGAGRVVGVDKRHSIVTTRVRLFRTKGGQLIWATERLNGLLEGTQEPAFDQIERADATVWESEERAWQFRPRETAELAQAAALAWHQAATREPALGRGETRQVA